MILLANENFPGPSIAYLRKSGYDILSVKETCPGLSDMQICEMAKNAKFIILTMDKDYGKIVFKKLFPDPPPIVFFRFAQGVPPDLAAKRFENLMAEDPILIDRITVITEDKIRHHHYDKI